MRAEKAPSMMDKIKAEFNGILDCVKSTNKNAVQVEGQFQSFAPSIQFITLDALHEEDYPHNIKQNSIFLIFQLDLLEHKVELVDYGHCWLSSADKQTKRYKYLAMKSMIDVHKDLGGKAFRKQGYKNEADAASKMVAYYDNVMKSMMEYTGGYPYKEGKQ